RTFSSRFIVPLAPLAARRRLTINTTWGSAYTSSIRTSNRWEASAGCKAKWGWERAFTCICPIWPLWSRRSWKEWRYEGNHSHYATAAFSEPGCVRPVGAKLRTRAFGTNRGSSEPGCGSPVGAKLQTRAFSTNRGDTPRLRKARTHFVSLSFHASAGTPKTRVHRSSHFPASLPHGIDRTVCPRRLR